MSRKTTIIIVILFAVIIAALFGTAYYISRETGQTTGEVLREFLPFGGEASDIERTFEERFGVTDEEEFAAEDGTAAPRPLLSQLTTSPISGATAFEREEALIVRYIDRATGHIFDLNLDDDVRNRVTNTTIPGIYEALWREDNVSFVARYLDRDGTVRTFSAEFKEPEDEGPATLSGSFLPIDITSLAASPDKTNIFYLANFGGRAIGTTALFDGAGKEEIFTSSFREWTGKWPSRRTVSLLSRPAAGMSGYLYLLNTETERVSKVLGPVPGLTARVSPDAARVLYSRSTDSSFSTHILNRERGEAAPFPLTTLPEKCVWSRQKEETLYCAASDFLPRAALPDAWHKGAVSFDDSLWSVRLETGAVSLLAAPRQFGGVSVDAINLFLDENERYLFFTDKKTQTLWSLKIAP